MSFNVSVNTVHKNWKNIQPATARTEAKRIDDNQEPKT